MRRCILLATLCLATVRLEAQVVDLLPAVRVRIQPSGAGADQMKGTLLSRTADSLVIATQQGVQYRFATGSIAKLAVSTGKSGSAGAAKGLKWGAGIGGPLFLLIGLGFGEDHVRRDPITGQIDTVKANPLAAFGVAAIGAGIYGGVGAIIGAAVGAEEWRSVGMVLPSISVAPERLRLGATVRLW